jgi:hypothetical protein
VCSHSSITGLTSCRVGQSAIVDSYNDDDMLEQSESLDSDEVRNDDGDEVVDPPDQWIDADDCESLDEKLAAETPDESRENWPSMEAHDSDAGGALEVVSNYELDRMDLTVHGRGRGQIDGAPEDGDSFYNVER